MARAEVKRGEIWLIDLGLAQKVRPAVVLSVPPLDQERALVSYVPRTTAVRRTRFEVPHTAPNFLPGVFDAQSLGTVPAVKLVRKLALVDSGTMNLVEASVCRWLGLAAAQA